MNPFAFQKFGRKALGIGAVALSLITAACGSTSNSGNGSSSSTTTGTSSSSTAAACSVSSSDLSLGTGGTATATKATISGSKTLKIDGSTALAPLFQDAQKAFDPANGTTTTVNPTGSGGGLTDASTGAVDIGMSDIFAVEKKVSGLTDHQVAAVIFSLVVSSDLAGKVTNLTSAQIQGIYSGSITTWDQVGGPSEPITVVVRKSGSGTRATFDRYVIGDPKTTMDQPATALVAPTTGDLVTDITSHQGAIGYTATGYVLNQSQASALNPICIDGFKPTMTDVAAGNYKFWSFEHAYTKTGGPADASGSAAQAFLSFVTSSAFQTMDLPKLGFLQIGQIPASVAQTHQVTS